MIKDCLQCFSPFKTKPSEGRKFCCRNCYKIWVSCSPERNPNYKNYPLKICNYCGNEYHSYNKNSKYCSHACADYCNTNEYRIFAGKSPRRPRKKRDKAQVKKPPKKYICPRCGTNEINRKNKSCKECKPFLKKMPFNCEKCNKPGWTYISRPKKFCSQTCQLSSYKGERNPNYIDGRTPENKRIRTSIEYKEWRTSVFKRDRYTCQECGQIGGELNADHIKPFAFYPDLRLDINNGRTLCKGCHMKTPTYLCNSKKSLLDLAPQSKYRGYTKDIQQEENHKCLH